MATREMPDSSAPPPTSRPGASTSVRERALVAFGYFVALIAVALGAAVFAIAFRELLSTVFRVAFDSRDIVSAFNRLPPVWRCVLPAIGGGLAGMVAWATARASQGHGVGDVMEAVVFGRRRLSMRITLLKSLGSWFAIVTGGSIGREGPLIQFGGTLGSSVGRLFRLADDHKRALMAAGTAAGFAAAYNTPVAAVLFVLEVVTGIVAMDAILGTIVAAAIATVVTRAVIGAGPIYGERAFELIGGGELVAYVALGLVAALAAQGFMRMLTAGKSLFARTRLPQPWRAGAGGLLVGLIAVWLPQVTGNGYEPLNGILDGALPLALVIWLLFAKALATTASVSSGSPGGVFTPTLFLGAAVGMCFHELLVLVVGGPHIGSSGAYALVGMAATTAATTHAPIMAAVLVFEFSRDYAVVVPLLLATAVATLLSRFMRSDSIYSAELRGRGVAWELTLEGRRVFDDKRSAGPSD